MIACDCIDSTGHVCTNDCLRLHQCWEVYNIKERGDFPPDGMNITVTVSSAKPALMTRFLYCFPLFWAVFRCVLGRLTLLRGVMTLGVTLVHAQGSLLFGCGFRDNLDSLLLSIKLRIH